MKNTHIEGATDCRAATSITIYRAKPTTKRNKNTHIEGATDCRAATSITVEQNQQQK